jgi:hypothetical protein
MIHRVRLGCRRVDFQCCPDVEASAPKPQRQATAASEKVDRVQVNLLDFRVHGFIG